MYISRKSLPRRTVLRGVGTLLALPLLDAMVPALSALAATPARAPRRLGFVYIPNGVIQDQWVPATTGPDFELSPTLRPLAKVKDHITVVSGLAQKQAESFGDGNGDHARGCASWLNGVHPKRTEGAGVQAGTTADQIAAGALGHDTRLPSLELALESQERGLGSCDNGYACVYINTISWRTPTSPVPMEIHPRAVFDRLFGDGGTPAARVAQARRNRSMLDSVLQEAASLRSNLGASDRTRVNEYLESVREVERRIERAETQASVSLQLPDRPTDIPEHFADHMNVMFDLQVLAFQADITRVSSLLIGREQSGRSFPEIGVPEPHHSVSHHRDDPVFIAKKAKIDEYHVQLYSTFLEKLQATPDGDGTLLDHSVVLYGGGLGNPNLHEHSNLPVLLAGRAGGAIKTGRHLAYPENTPMTNLLVSLLDAVGVPAERLGDSTGRLDSF
ncbi:MAG: DUF1552 domain-containing protein [Vicinamibacterales bacterium]